MKTIITALANPILNQKLKENKKINLLFQDIQYQEAIFEILESEKNIQIDFLLISEELPGEMAVQELIEKIKKENSKIKIILISEEKNEELENILYNKGVYKILYNKQTSIDEIIHLINREENNINQELKDEIDILKQMIIEGQNKQQKNIKEINKDKSIKDDLLNIINKKIKKNKIKKENRKSEVISISGPSGVGKSIISVNIAKAMINRANKILIIDFDILNNSLHTILGVKKYPPKIEKNKKEISNFIIKINKKIDLITITELLFNREEKMEITKFINILNQLKEIYNIIIIDTSSECFFDYTKNIIKYSNKNIFVVEANILEIKKGKNLLNIYINEWKIDKSKFNILFNKYNEEAINIKLLKQIFHEFNIIGTLKYEAKYNKLINKNIRNNLINKKIRKEYLKIQKEI